VIDADAFAALLCEWCLEAQPGQQVVISSTTLGAEPARAVHREMLLRGAWPFVRLEPPELHSDFFRYARDLHLDTYPPLALADAQGADAFLRIDAPANTSELADVDPQLIARQRSARALIQETVLSRRWCGTQWPTPALAQRAGMSEGMYADFLERALFLDRADPVGAWRELSARQATLVQRLKQGRTVRIRAEGTDLTLRVDGRTWINSDGRRNMPSGEVFTSPLEDSAEGRIRFTVPSNHRGVEVVDAELEFSSGEVVAARAARGEPYLLAALATDAGAKRLGELGIGTNAGVDRPTGSTLLDEKMAGTVHLALGRSYAETAGRNVSALHWDLICDLRAGGELTVDGEPLGADFAGR
jgi:aminopeptidase